MKKPYVAYTAQFNDLKGNFIRKWGFFIRDVKRVEVIYADTNEKQHSWEINWNDMGSIDYMLAREFVKTLTDAMELLEHKADMDFESAELSWEDYHKLNTRKKG